MRFILIVVLILLFVYSLALVLLNGMLVSVDLWFSHIPEMRVGLLVLITLALGVILGLLLGVQVFRVFQSRWEIQRLHKEIDQLRKEQIQHAQLAATEAIAHQPSEKTSLDISPEDKSPL